MKDPARKLSQGNPAIYRISLAGKLEETWSDYVEGMNITVEQKGESNHVTTLTGLLVDQAALNGVLANLYTLGFYILSVECLDCE